METSKNYRVVRYYDPAIRLRLSDDGTPHEKDKERIAKYVTTRDPDVLEFDGEPVWFELRPLRNSEWRNHVDAVPGREGEEHRQKECFRRAFECALVKIEGLRDADGNKRGTVTPEREREGGPIKQGWLDKLQDEYGIGDTDVLEIGAVAYQRAKLPFGSEPAYQAPRSSFDALEIRIRNSLLAGPRSRSSKSSSATSTTTRSSSASGQAGNATAGRGTSKTAKRQKRAK